MSHNQCYTLGDIAKRLNIELRGDERCRISSLGTLKSAQAGQLSFLSNSSYIDQLADCQASAVILPPDLADRWPGNALLTEAPYVAFAHASALFAPDVKREAGVHPSASVASDAVLARGVSVAANAVVESGARIGEDSSIGAGSVVGAGARIGANCRLQANVTLYREVVLGNRVTVHSTAVIGADGFGYAFDGQRSIKIHQLGSVRIGDDVEIGAGTTIDRGALDDTIIEQGVKIDNQVQIGHNCHIGEHTVICGCSAIAGSATIGKYCVLGGGSGVVGHLRIADGVQLSAMTLVDREITEPGVYSSGTGFMQTPQWKRNTVRFKQLDSIARRLKELEKQTDIRNR
ncbi:MAG: UDP-3-O-(3-hydroxymyristoyl)glucosamine N-acyltransferase [Pseudohongiellaceae bacterium]